MKNKDFKFVYSFEGYEDSQCKEEPIHSSLVAGARRRAAARRATGRWAACTAAAECRPTCGAKLQ